MVKGNLGDYGRQTLAHSSLGSLYTDWIGLSERYVNEVRVMEQVAWSTIIGLGVWVA